MASNTRMVLVVSDRGPDAGGLLRMCDAPDAMTVVANGIEQGGEILRNISAEAVLLDLSDSSAGKGILDHIAQQIHPCPPVVLFIAEDDAAVAEAFMNAGGADFIVRSENPDMMKLRIHTAVNRLRSHAKIDGAHQGICRYTFRAYDDIAEMCDMFLSAIAEYLQVERAVVGKIVDETYCVEYCHDRSGLLGPGQSFPLGWTFCKRVAETKAPVVIGDTGKTTEWRAGCAALQKGVASYLGVPLFVNGEFFGTLSVCSARQRDFSASAVDVLTLFAQKIGGEMTRLEMESEVKVARRHWMELQVIYTVNRLMASVAHEMRQPLVAADLELAEAGGRVVAGGPSSELIGSARGKIQDTLGTIRTMMKMHRGQARAPVEVDINRELDDALALFRRAAGDVEIVREYAEGATVVTDGNLSRIFVNIIGNAFEAMAKKGRLKLATGAKGGDMEVLIEDSGNGIAAPHIQKIFDAGFTTKTDGTGGPGLWLARQEVSRIGGDIRVESLPGAITRFRVRIPRREEALRPSLREQVPAEPEKWN